MEETNEQLIAQDKVQFYLQSTCPKCKTNSSQYLEIENPGEDKTQVYCSYDCGYIYIEDYLSETI